MLLPLLSFNRYVNRMSITFLAEYLNVLPSLHPAFVGLTLPGSRVVGSSKPLPEQLLSFLNQDCVPLEGFVCRHIVRSRAKCNGFTWEINFKRFQISGSLFEDFLETDVGEELLFTTQAPDWIKQGLCSHFTRYGEVVSEVGNAWDVYLSIKNQYRYELEPRASNSLLDYWGEYSEEKRELVADMLDVLQPYILSYHPEFFSGNVLNQAFQAEKQNFVRYADERLARDLGKQQLNAMLSVFDMGLDHWLAAGELKSTHHNISDILLPS